MSKYDFGYDLEVGSTNEWAFNIISNKSKVLEIGPAIGNLTYHLVNEKNCIVDIIEIDEESGKKAAEYARKALLGSVYGNLNENLWYEILEEERYDYIIGLDVLEHIQNPQHTLGKLKSLLNDKGRIILSIPNIAHNAVLINLLSNKFEYTDIGLLDSTHIHFFTFESIMQMIKNVDLEIECQDAIIKYCTDTEQNIDCSNLTPYVEEYLRNRQYGDVYQFLLILDKAKCLVDDRIGKGISEGSLFDTKVLINGQGDNILTYKYCDGEIDITVDLTKYDNVTSIRFVPMEQACEVRDLICLGYINENEKKLGYNWVSGVELSDDTILFSKEYNEVNYLLTEKYDYVKIKCKCNVFDENVVKKVLSEKEKQNNEIEKVYKEINILDGLYNDRLREIEIKENEICDKNKRINDLEEQLSDSMKTIQTRDRELEIIKGKKWYKFFNKMETSARGIRDKVWKK